MLRVDVDLTSGNTYNELGSLAYPRQEYLYELGRVAFKGVVLLS